MNKNMTQEELLELFELSTSFESCEKLIKEYKEFKKRESEPSSSKMDMISNSIYSHNTEKLAPYSCVRYDWQTEGPPRLKPF